MKMCCSSGLVRWR